MHKLDNRIAVKLEFNQLMQLNSPDQLEYFVFPFFMAYFSYYYNITYEKKKKKTLYIIYKIKTTKKNNPHNLPMKLIRCDQLLISK